MGKALRVCTEPGCPELVESGHCAQHRREAESARGTFHQRYGTHHRQLRRHVARVVASGHGVCWRCGRAIDPDEVWHLGHLDGLATYGGAECVECNTSAAGRSSHGLPPRRPTVGGDPC